MQNDTQPNSDNASSNPNSHQQPNLSGDQKVIQPSSELVQELQTQQQQPHSAVEPTQQSESIGQQPTYSEPTVSNNGQMQVGVSASQMGLNQPQSSKNWKSVLKPLITTIVLLILLGGVFLFFNGRTGYAIKTVQGDGFTYSITFSKISSTVTLNGKSYLEGKDKKGQKMLLYVGKSVQSTYDCHNVSGGTITIVSTPTIESNQHNLCYSQSLNAYDMNFTHNSVWYFLAILPQDKSVTLDQDTIKMIASSVNVQ